MNRQSYLLHVLGMLLLAAGLALPWLSLDPIGQRSERLHHLEVALSGQNLPVFIREPLKERGYRVGLSPERLNMILSGGEDGAILHFNFVEGRERLYAWDFWRVPSGGWLRLASLNAGLILIVALVISITGQSVSKLTSQRSMTALGFGSLITALLVILTAPLADTFGLVGGGDVSWGAAWLDVLSGAEVAPAPRILVPVGLLLLAIAQLARYIQSISETEAEPPTHDIDWSDDEGASGWGVRGWKR